jgi:hypothetical protein
VWGILGMKTRAAAAANIILQNKLTGDDLLALKNRLRDEFTRRFPLKLMMISIMLLIHCKKSLVLQSNMGQAQKLTINLSDSAFRDCFYFSVLFDNKDSQGNTILNL